MSLGSASPPASLTGAPALTVGHPQRGTQLQHPRDAGADHRASAAVPDSDRRTRQRWLPVVIPLAHAVLVLDDHAADVDRARHAGSEVAGMPPNCSVGVTTTSIGASTGSSLRSARCARSAQCHTPPGCRCQSGSSPCAGSAGDPTAHEIGLQAVVDVPHVAAEQQHGHQPEHHRDQRHQRATAVAQQVAPSQGQRVHARPSAVARRRSTDVMRPS